MKSMDPEQFAGYVRDALHHYYDPARLQVHPLLGLVLPQGASHASQPQALRLLILDKLNELRPGEQVPFGDVAWFPHRVLWMRYIDGQEVNDICGELAIGRSSFYEHHRAAMEALVNLLWRLAEEQRETQEREETGEDGEGAFPLVAEDPFSHELEQVAQAARLQPVDLAQLLARAIETLEPLAHQRGIRIVLRMAEPLPSVWADAALLRQAFVNILADATALASDPTLHLVVSVARGEVVCGLAPLSLRDSAGSEEFKLPGHGVAQRLLDCCGGRISTEADQTGHDVLIVSLGPDQARQILIVDNDPDTISLYQRYLRSEPYAVRGVTTAQLARDAIEEQRPDLILLDLVMPDKDGWAILEELKHDPETADIPIIVCSVLEQPQLALALGAAHVLNKPIDRAMLIETIQVSLAVAWQ